MALIKVGWTFFYFIISRLHILTYSLFARTRHYVNVSWLSIIVKSSYAGKNDKVMISQAITGDEISNLKKKSLYVHFACDESQVMCMSLNNCPWSLAKIPVFCFIEFLSKKKDLHNFPHSDREQLKSNGSLNNNKK